MKLGRRAGYIVGTILFIIWAVHFLVLSFTPADQSLLIELFRSTLHGIFAIGYKTSKTLTCVFSVFNCLASALWTFGVYKTNSKNKNWLMVMTTIWMAINLILFTFFCLRIFFSAGIHVVIIIYLYGLLATIIVVVLFTFPFIITCKIYDSFDKEDRRLSRLNDERNNQNRQQQFDDDATTDDDKNRMLATDQWRSNDSIVVPMPNRSQLHLHPDRLSYVRLLSTLDISSILVPKAQPE